MRRQVKWSVQLSELDIEYHARGAIKGQVVTDFIAEYTHTPKDEARAQGDQPGETKATKTTWMLYVDGCSISKSAGGGIVLVTSEGTKLEYVVRFEFKATNNEAEYESLLDYSLLVPLELSES